jgi:hypothetical protein
MYRTIAAALQGKIDRITGFQTSRLAVRLSIATCTYNVTLIVAMAPSPLLWQAVVEHCEVATFALAASLHNP